MTNFMEARRAVAKALGRAGCAITGKNVPPASLPEQEN